jgi:hypothetical protein
VKTTYKPGKKKEQQTPGGQTDDVYNAYRKKKEE